MAEYATSPDPDPALPEPDRPERDLPESSVAQNSSRSELAASACYWSALLLVAATAAYLAYWRLHHPDVITVPPAPDDPFGIATPPWVPEWSAGIYIAAVLTSAANQARRGRRAWICLVTATFLLAVIAMGHDLKAALVK